MPCTELRPTHTSDELRAVARYHSLVSICLGVQLAVLVGFVVLTATVPEREWDGGMAILTGLWLLACLAGGVAVGLLAGSAHGAAAGIILGPLAAVPCLGFVVMLVVLVLANGVFRRHGVRLGLFGPKAADLDNLDLVPKEDDAGAYLPDDDEGW